MGVEPITNRSFTVEFILISETANIVMDAGGGTVYMADLIIDEVTYPEQVQPLSSTFITSIITFI